MIENRVGRGFGNPDYTSDYYYQYRGVHNWGYVVTADELRYIYAFGNELASTSGYVYTDAMLMQYIDRSIGYVERDLGIVIVATQYRHRPPLHGVSRQDLSPDSVHEWSDLMEFSRKNFEQYVTLKLPKKPIVELQKWSLFDPGTGNVLIDLTPWSKLNYHTGLVQAYPRAGTGLYTFPVIGPVGGFSAGGIGLYPSNYNTYPYAYGVDFIAGFQNSSKVPMDLVEVIGMLAAINLLADFGDGITSGLANASVSLSGISESFGTTMSATSAWFGARIKDYSDRLDKWYKNNRTKYQGLKFRVV